MDRLIEILLSNSGSAAVLAIVAALAGRFLKRPAIVHLLWLVVLLKLLMPPMFELNLIPARPTPGVVVPSVGTAIPDAHPTVTSTELNSKFDLREVAVGLWLLGAVVALGLASVRTISLGRMMANSRLPDTDLLVRVAKLSLTIGIRRPPSVRVVDGPLPPLLWGFFARVELVLPSRLLEQLQSDELDTLIAHELAHLKRRDHWVRHIELFVMLLFWWYPVAWWARKRARIAEELSCDAIVTRSLPGKVRAYADGLLKTMTYLSQTRSPKLVAVSEAGGLSEMKGRLKMILSREQPKPVSWGIRALLVATAITVLAVFPSLTPGVAASSHDGFTGEPLTLYLQDAQILETLGHFSKISEFSIIAHSTAIESNRLNQTVTISAEKQPWDKVLTGILTDAGLSWTLDGDIIWVHDADFDFERDRRFTGEPISISVKDADIRDVISTFSDISELDIVLDSSVSGSVTVDLHDVPWDQALNLILSSNGFGYKNNGETIDIYRVSSAIGRQLDSKSRVKHHQAISTMAGGEVGYLGDTPLYRFVKDGDITEPVFTNNPGPEYPAAALRAGIQGAVILETIIDADGIPVSVKVERGLPLGCSEAAVETVRNWRFEPATRNGEPVAVLYILAVRFRLDDDSSETS